MLSGWSENQVGVLEEVVWDSSAHSPRPSVFAWSLCREACSDISAVALTGCQVCVRLVQAFVRVLHASVTHAAKSYVYLRFPTKT